MGLFTLTHGFTIIEIGLDKGLDRSLIFAIILFALILALLFTKNLGKRASLIICALIFVMVIALVASSAYSVTGLAVDDGPGRALILGRNATHLIHAFLLFILTYAKYLNKADR